MTELTGDCSEPLKVASLVYHGPAGTVNSVSFRVTGTVSHLGEICCALYENCPEDTHPWFLTWWGTIEKFDDPDPIYGKWVASTPDYLDQVIPFDQTGAAESQNAFASLSDGDVFDVELYFGHAGWIGECDVITPPAGTMVTVTILMDVSYTVPTQISSWGRIKALYE